MNEEEPQVADAVENFENETWRMKIIFFLYSVLDKFVMCHTANNGNYGRYLHCQIYVG